MKDEQNKTQKFGKWIDDNSMAAKTDVHTNFRHQTLWQIAKIKEQNGKKLFHICKNYLMTNT